MNLYPALALLSLGIAAALPAAQPQVKLTPLADRVRVEIGGQHFTDYVFGDGASRSYCYPILAADGTPLTRDFPMKTTPGEDTDHPWQRSLYFAHSMVNGIDFWNEGTGDAGRSPKEKGHTVLDGKIETTDGAIGVLRARNRWLAPTAASSAPTNAKSVSTPTPAVASSTSRSPCAPSPTNPSSSATIKTAPWPSASLNG